MLSFKDIAAINKEFHKGIVVNKSSLDYALDQAKRTKSWLKAAAYLVRSVLIDHVFEDGNKRTAAGIIMLYYYINKLDFDKKAIDETVIRILKKNINSITQIERLIKNVGK